MVNGNEARVILAGDMVTDYHLLDGGILTEGPRGEEFLSASPQPGGVALLDGMLNALGEHFKWNFNVYKLFNENILECADYTQLIQNFMLWKDFRGKQNPAWRIKQKMGYNYKKPEKTDDPRIAIPKDKGKA